MRRLTPAPAAALGVGIVLLGAALTFGRADLAVAGAVLLTAIAAALGARRPSPDDQPAEPVVLELERLPAHPGDEGMTVLPVALRADAVGAELVVITATEAQHRTRRIAAAGPHARARLTVSTPHTGDQEIVVADASPVGADGLWVGATGAHRRLTARLEPQAVRLPFLPLPRDPSGLTGAHDARRAGDGGEFRDIHPFAAGDRLQRIDWKATARLARRPGDLFVRRTFATADIDVALIIDDGDDVTGRLGDWARGERGIGLPGSMDVARQAAWSLASAYLDAGDQVSFQLLSRLGSAVPRGSGARHRQRLRAAITASVPQTRYTRHRTPLVAPGALVVLLSTFLDDETVSLVGLWRAAGHRVVAVDTLPQLRDERLRREQIAASRIVLGMRADRLREVRGMGADLLVWDGDAGARAAALRTMARQRRRG